MKPALLRLVQHQRIGDRALVSLAMTLRHWNGLAPQQTLYAAFPEYVLGQKYHGSIQHRFAGNRELQDRLRGEWPAFSALSQLDQGEIQARAEAVCRRRSDSMLQSLAALATADADYYLVTFGPLHLCRLLQGLVARDLSYLIVAP